MGMLFPDRRGGDAPLAENLFEFCEKAVQGGTVALRWRRQDRS
jgi:hypothetical protein